MGISCIIDSQNSDTTNSANGLHPGYYKQWFEEKKDANGKIPPFLRTQWAKWDAQQIIRRADESPIDSIIELGPKNVAGRTRSIWIDPRNEKIILAAAISGGLWRSENGGLSWKPNNEQQISMMPSCITSNPYNPNEVYYGTGESRANSADVDGEGVFKSIDGGKTFTQIQSTTKLAGFNAIWDIEHSKIDSQTLFVGTHSNGLYRSQDGGKTWANVYKGGNNQINEIVCLPSGRIIATMQSSLVIASDSNGNPGTFTAVNFPNAPGSGKYRRIQMAYCSKYPSVVFAVFEGYAFLDNAIRFYKSSDGGVHWIQKTAPTAGGASYQGYCLLLGAHPTDSAKVVCGGTKIVSSSNGGETWTPIANGHADHHCFAYLPKSTNEFIIGSDGGMHKYRWTSSEILANLNNGYKVTQFYCGSFGPSGMVGIAGAQDNGTHVVSNPLESQSFFGGDGAYCHIGLQDGSVAYMSYQNAAIHRMTNFNPTNASNAVNITDPAFKADGVDFINLYEMNPMDQNMVFYRTNRFLYRTTNMGEVWNVMNKSIRAGIKAIGISHQENPVVYFGGISTQLYKIENAGLAPAGKEVNFNSSAPTNVTNDNIKGLHVHPNDPYTLYVALSNLSNQPRAWRVTGLDSVSKIPTWKNISGNLPIGLPVNMLAVDPLFPDRVFFAGTDFGLYYSIDSGKTWNKDYRVPNVSLHEIKMRDDRTLFLFTHGRGMFALPLNHVDVTSANRLQTEKLKSYPNPTNNTVEVHATISLLNAEYTVINTNGQVVLKGRLSAGQSIPMKEQQNGSYFIQVKSGNQLFTSKILKNEK